MILRLQLLDDDQQKPIQGSIKLTVLFFVPADHGQHILGNILHFILIIVGHNIIIPEEITMFDSHNSTDYQNYDLFERLVFTVHATAKF